MNAEVLVEKSHLELNHYSDFTVSSPSQLALQDIREGLSSWRIWTLLSWQDIRLRYRRSQLGPFWLTISMAITIYMMGFLYGHLFHLAIRNYFPFLAAGMLVWNFISFIIIDSTNAFIVSEHFLKQMKLPYSVFILRIISRTFIIFLHNIVVLVPLFFIFHIQLTLAMFMVIPGLLLLFVNAFIYGLLLAILGTRYRDLGQLINSLIQVIFFLTPIMWSPSTLPQKYQILIWINPFAQYIEILRAPLVGMMPALYSIIFVLMMTVIGMGLALAVLARTRHRIVYWL